MRVRDLSGRKAVLAFHLQGTAPTARAMNRAVEGSNVTLSYQGERSVEAVLEALEVG